MTVADELGAAQDALNRMQRAFNRGTGCHLTAEMVRTLSVTMIGEMWTETDPRALATQENNHAG